MDLPAECLQSVRMSLLLAAKCLQIVCDDIIDGSSEVFTETVTMAGVCYLVLWLSWPCWHAPPLHWPPAAHLWHACYPDINRLHRHQYLVIHIHVRWNFKSQRWINMEQRSGDDPKMICLSIIIFSIKISNDHLNAAELSPHEPLATTTTNNVYHPSFMTVHHTSSY